MEVRGKRCCVLVYNSFLDPLFQNLMYQYIRTLAKTAGHRFYIITFEQPQYSLSAKQHSSFLKEFKELGIVWYPRKHRSGRMLLVKKAIDFLSVFLVLLKLRMSGVKIVWSFANVAASISWVYSKILGLTTIIFSYEPHSSFMAELGLWSKNSLKYKILQFLESRAGLDGDYVLTGTKFMQSELSMKKVKGKVFRAPTGVDENDFYFRPEAFHQVRIKHGFRPSDKLVLYIGKFGTLYYTWEIMLLLKMIEQNVPDTRFIVISSNLHSEIKNYCDVAGFNPEHILYLTNIPAEDIKSYISASNIGISAVPPTPSQRYRSPTKVAEYLLCGLPFITCHGISEDDLVVNEKGVGVSLAGFSKEEINSKMTQIRGIIEADKTEMSAKCRQAGLAYRSKSAIDEILIHVFREIEAR